MNENVLLDAKMKLDELARGFQSSTILLTACKFGVFAAIGRSAKSAGELAKELELDERALEIVLLALAADDILISSNSAFRVSPKVAPFLLPDGAQTQESIMNHNYNCMLRWAQLGDVLRTGEPIPFACGERSPDQLRDFICGMANISRISSVECTEKFDFSSYRRLLDVGGGPGTSSIVFAQNNPQLRCVVFDLEGPIAIAREEIDKAGIGDRVETRVGDYYQNDLGEGFDLVYISNIIHAIGPADTKMLCAKAHDALDDGGTLIIKDFFLEDDRFTPAFAARFSVNMLVGTERGKSYTLTETKEILSEIGFGNFEKIDVAAASGLLIAKKKTP